MSTLRQHIVDVDRRAPLSPVADRGPVDIGPAERERHAPRARSLAARLPPDARNASTLLDRPFDRAAAERQFHRAMVSGSERLKQELRYNATYFKRMVDADAGLAAAKQLLGGCPQDYSEGFTTLWEKKR